MRKHERVIRAAVGLVLAIMLTAPLPSHAGCSELEGFVRLAVEERDLDELYRLLPMLHRQADCRPAYLRKVERLASNLAARRADALVQAEKLEEAEEVLERVPATTWPVAALRGDIGYARKDWPEASRWYNTAYELALDPANRPPPGDKTLTRLFEHASQALVLSGRIGEEVFSRGGEAKGIFRRPPCGENKGSFHVSARLPAPVRFHTARADLDPQGELAAEVVSRYLKRIFTQEGGGEIILHGHADERGDEAYNWELSRLRANTLGHRLKRSLTEAGINLRVRVVPHGETTPFPLPEDSPSLEDAERWALDRRVEFEIVKGVNPCAAQM